MKVFTIIKIGYTAGVYGCTNEYFTLIAIDGDNYDSRTFYGMYGAEHRVKDALTEQGYKPIYVNSIYGRMTRNDIPKKAVFSEYTLIDAIKKGGMPSY